MQPIYDLLKANTSKKLHKSNICIRKERTESEGEKEENRE
jgi:hypothetical protein